MVGASEIVAALHLAATNLVRPANMGAETLDAATTRPYARGWSTERAPPAGRRLEERRSADEHIE